MAALNDILVVLGVSLGYMAPTAAVGATQRELKGRRIWLLGLTFALVMSGVFALGAGAGQLSRSLARGPRGQWGMGALALAMMLGLGIHMLRGAAGRVQLVERRAAPVTPGEYARTAAQWSLPIALAGAVLGLSQDYRWDDAALAFLLNGLVCATGLMTGYRQGGRFVRPAYAIGGVALCLAALRMLAGG